MLQPLWDFSYGSKQTLSMTCSQHTFGQFPKEAESLCPYKNLYKDVYGSVIRNCQNLKTPKMTFGRENGFFKMCYFLTMEYYSKLKKTGAMQPCKDREEK